MTPDFLSAAAEALVLSLPEPTEAPVCDDDDFKLCICGCGQMPKTRCEDCDTPYCEGGKCNPCIDDASSCDSDDDACSFCDGTGFNDGVGCKDCLTEECFDCECTIKQIDCCVCEWCDETFCEDCFLNDDSDFHQTQAEEVICRRCLDIYAEEVADRANGMRANGVRR